MADVYLAWDERVGRKVAIKIMKADDLDQQTLNRFLKEASQVVGWNHPHILRVYEDAKLELLDAVNGSVVPYIVMEYVTGGDLQKRLKHGQPYPLAETLRIFGQLCSAVQYAHGRNVIHRDLKPHNILFRRLLDGSEQVVLGDFGLAVQVDATHHTFAHGGTLAYMAPEQLGGQAIRSSDIFALGVILYQLCTGTLPFRRSLLDLQYPDPFETPERPGIVNPTLPKVLDGAILTALAEDPTERFETASLFWEHVRLAILLPPIQEVSAPLSKDDKDKEGTHPLADPLPPATRSAHNVSKLVINGAKGQAGHSNVMNSPDTRLVEFPQLHGKNINQLPASQRNSGKMPLAEAAGAGAELGVGVPPSPTRIGGVGGGGAGAARRGNRRRLLALAFILLLIGGIVLTSGGGIVPHIFPGTTAATVTITPASTVVSETYSINAVSGGTIGKSQVAARILSSTKSQSGTVNATGTGQIPAATQATGSLTFYNVLSVSQTVGSGTVLTGADGVQVVNNVPAVIPAANPPTEGFVIVAAHAVQAGAKGNIAPLDINGACCLTGVTVRNNAAFSGGQDPKNFTEVSQSDINGFAIPLETSLTAAAKIDVTSQKKANEQFDAPVSCSPATIDSNPKVGQAATKVTITVTVTCSGEVYDESAAFSLAQTSLVTKANQNPGAGYALVGTILTMFKQANAVDSKGTIALLIFAEGKWAYQFTDAQKKSLANLIKGKSKSDAQTILLQLPGVSKASINISGEGNTLPTDPTQINIVVQSVEGFQVISTPSAGTGIPTSSGSTATSGTSTTPTTSLTAA